VTDGAEALWMFFKANHLAMVLAKVSNCDVLNRVVEDHCIVNTIKQRKHKWLGHDMSSVMMYHREIYWKAG